MDETRTARAEVDALWKRMCLALAEGRLAQAEADALVVMSAQQDAAGELYLAARQWRAQVLSRQGRHAESALEWSGLIEAPLPGAGGRDARLLRWRLNYSGQLVVLQRYGDAEAEYHRVMRDRRRAWPRIARDELRFDAEAGLVTVLNRRGQHAAGESRARSAIRAAGRDLRTQHSRWHLRLCLAASLAGQEHYDEAERILRRLRLSGEIHMMLVHLILADVQLGLGVTGAAEATIRVAAAAAQRLLGPANWLAAAIDARQREILTRRLDEAARQPRAGGQLA